MKHKFISTLILLFIILFNTYGQDDCKWKTSGLTEGKRRMGIASHGNKVFYAGGVTCDDTELDVVEVFDTENFTWDTIGNLVPPRLNSRGVTCGNKVMFAGGVSDKYSAFYSSVDIYDTITQEWTRDNLSVRRMVSGVSNGEMAIFAGGAVSADFKPPLARYFLTDVVDIYNCKTGEWSTDKLPMESFSEAAAVVGDFAFFARGYIKAGEVSNKIDIYNFKSREWSVDSLSVARGWVQAVSVGTKVLFAGGVTNQNIKSDIVDIYDLETGLWTTAKLSYGRAFLNNNSATTTSGNLVIFAGGCNLNLYTQFFDLRYFYVDIYDASNDSWSFDELSASRGFAAVSSAIDVVVIAGAPPCITKLVEIFDCTNGAVEISNQSGITIYPNPADKILNIQNLSGREIEQLSLYNIFGQRVLRDYVQADMIDISSLQTGIYTIEIVIEGDKYVETVIIK